VLRQLILVVSMSAASMVNANVETQTDSRGHFWLSAPTPPAPIPGSSGTDTLLYEKAGYKTLIFRNFATDGEERRVAAASTMTPPIN
jgi:hypothetical protein